MALTPKQDRRLDGFQITMLGLDHDVAMGCGVAVPRVHPGTRSAAVLVELSDLGADASARPSAGENDVFVRGARAVLPGLEEVLNTPI